jgi:shikimate kinase
MKLFLVGLPGSGKSTIGKNLANILNIPFLDTDDFICERENTTIEEIFKIKGEGYFREYEKKVLQELIHLPEFILSTGGGLPCFFNNMEVINKSGVSIFLDVPPATICKRLWTTNNQNRPLLKGKTEESLLDYLIVKHQERLPYYSKSKVVLNGDQLDAERIIKELKSKKLI